MSAIPIQTIRQQKVLLDADLAILYGVSTKVFNQAVKRNEARFPEDFRFQLSADEYESLLRSQTVTLKRGQHRKYLPYVFTEHGALQAANILRSEKAKEMSNLCGACLCADAARTGDFARSFKTSCTD